METQVERRQQETHGKATESIINESKTQGNSTSKNIKLLSTNRKLLSTNRRVMSNTPAHVETRQLLSFSVNRALMKL